MKRFVFLSMFVLLAAFASAAVNTQYIGKAPNILVSLINQEPDPVEPGKQVEVNFKLDNNGTTAENVVFEIVPEYPFSLLPGDNAKKFLGEIGTSQTGKYSVTLKYNLKVAENAVDGYHEIKVKYKNDNFDSWIAIEGLKIKVQSHDAIMSLDNFFTSPAVTPPGKKTKLTVTLRNYATSLLKNVKISLNLDKNGDDEFPFAPIDSTNEKVISYIEPKASVPVEFDLLVDADAVSKAYKIPLNIKYSDVLNKNYSKTNLVTVIVGDKPDLGITLERTDIYTTKSSGSVVLRLVNKGAPDIKFLNVKVLQNENIEVIGADEVYVGKLDSDDFSTAEFKVFVSGKESVAIPVQVDYRDTNNNIYKENREVKLKLYSNSEAKSIGVKKNSSLTWIVLIIAAIVAGIYYYRKRKSRK